MKNHRYLIVALLLLTCSLQVFAQLSPDQKKQRIQASYAIVSGRAPLPGEIEHWMKQPDLTVDQLVQHHLDYAAKEVSFKRNLIINSYQHALGRKPTEDEIKFWNQHRQTYNQLMKNHVNWLGNGNREYEAVINRSYEKVFNRPATPEELAWWKKQNTYSYAILCQCHMDYAKRNKSGTFNTISSTASSIMNAIQITGNTVQEVQKVMDLTPVSNVLAQGAAGVQSMLGSILPIFTF